MILPVQLIAMMLCLYIKYLAILSFDVVVHYPMVVYYYHWHLTE